MAKDSSDKLVTVNSMTLGNTENDMYVGAARKYIPGPDNYSDETIDEV